VSGEEIYENSQDFNFAETVRNVKNSKKGIKFTIEAMNIEKTSLTLEEICERYAVMFQIYNEERKIIDTKNEKVNIDGNEVGKVTLKVKGESEDSIVIAYLMSLENKEITVTFIGQESSIIRNENEINKIINSIKVYKKERKNVKSLFFKRNNQRKFIKYV